MALAVERIVVQASAHDKEAITAKARKLALPVSELMRRGAFAYEASDDSATIDALADLAAAAADRACRRIDETLAFIAESTKRIEALEAAHANTATEGAAWV